MKQLISWQDIDFYLLDGSEDQPILDQVVELHNNTFPASRHINSQLLKQRAKNGFCIGGFTNHQLVCSISGFSCDAKLIDTAKNWNEFTGKDTYSTSNAEGDIVLLTAVSSRSTSQKPIRPETTQSTSTNLPFLTEQALQEYIDSDQDYVNRFHRLPKAGMPNGASVRRLVPGGSPEDAPSLGYIIIYEYPELEGVDFKFTATKAGVAAAEAAMYMAIQQGKRQVMALSRFGQLSSFYKL